jgi:hypothetical protein
MVDDGDNGTDNDNGECVVEVLVETMTVFSSHSCQIELKISGVRWRNRAFAQMI